MSFAVQDGVTALHSAAVGGHVAAMEWLVAKGADVQVATKVCCLRDGEASMVWVDCWTGLGDDLSGDDGLWIERWDGVYSDALGAPCLLLCRMA